MASSYTSLGASGPGADCEAARQTPLVNEEAPIAGRRRSTLLGGVLALCLVAYAAGAQMRLRLDSSLQPAALADAIIEASQFNFDCQAGLDNWLRGWSEVKKEWCCTYHKLGCEGNPIDYDGTEPFDCSASTGSSEFDWSVPKKTWCCNEKNAGCPQVHHVTMTFLLTEVNYAALKQTQFIITEVINAVKSSIVDIIDGHATAEDMDLKYWAGSGSHASTEDLDNTGVVFQSRISVPPEDKVDEVRAALSSVMFPVAMTKSVRGVSGMDSLSFGKPTARDVMVEMAIVRACECEDGQPAGPPVCPKSGGRACDNCHEGFHLTSTYSCVKNLCHCEGGIPSEGQLCEKHMAQSCSSCLPGFHYNVETQGCLENKCTCPMGFPASGGACTMHLGEICGSCYPGYHVDLKTKQCKASMCHCPDGKAVDAKECPADGAIKCKSCSKGFHLDSEGQCMQNKCTCEQGTPALGDLCHKHGGEVCAFCKAEYYLHKDGKCGEKECLCANGTSATGYDCKTNGATVCTSCNTGFTLHDSRQCLLDKCHCENGLSLEPEACLIPGESSCASCFEGYRLVGKECVPNRCQCDNGDPSVGKACPAPGAQACAACKPGFRHLLQPSPIGNDMTLLCIPNKCVCTAGGHTVGEPALGATKTVCHSEGANVCIACYAGYHVEGEQCMVNQCRCDKGNVVDSEHCTKHGATNCTSCHEGHWLAEGPRFTVEPEYLYKPDFSDWEGGAKLCMEDQATTKKPFDCLAALENWEQAWSDTKKAWCCDNEDRGCIAESSGKQMCENKGYDFQQCGMVGCCQFNLKTDQCMSAIGDQACFPEFSIRSHEGLCVGVDTTETLNDDAMVGKLMKCQKEDVRQVWRPDSNMQIGSPTGFCLQLTDQKVDGRVSVAKCVQTVPPPAEQRFQYQNSKIMIRDTSPALCLSSASSPLITAARCEAADLKQKWTVPEVQEVA